MTLAPTHEFTHARPRPPRAKALHARGRSLAALREAPPPVIANDRRARRAKRQTKAVAASTQDDEAALAIGWIFHEEVRPSCPSIYG